MSGYLPAWATLEEAERWLSEATGEAWPLPRLIAAGLWPRVWLHPPDPDHPAAAAVAPVFEGEAVGYLAEFVFGGDAERLAIDRTAVLSLTFTPSGELVRFDPPIGLDLADLRFSGDDLRELAKAPGTPKGAILTRRELIARHAWQWPTIDADLREASRRHPGLAAAMAGGGRWHEAAALAWARENDRIRDGGNAAARPAAGPWGTPPKR